MKIVRVFLQILSIALATAWSTSLVPYFPFWFNKIEFWLIIPLIIAPGNLKIGIITAICLGWLIDVYSPNHGLFFLLLPLTSIAVHFIATSWRTHRDWLRNLGALTIGISIFHLLVVGYELGYALILTGESFSAHLIDSLVQFPATLSINLIIGLLCVKLINSIFLIKPAKQFYA